MTEQRNGSWIKVVLEIVIAVLILVLSGLASIQSTRMNDLVTNDRTQDALISDLRCSIRAIEQDVSWIRGKLEKEKGP